MRAKITITEEYLKKRLESQGKTPEEIENLINEYVVALNEEETLDLDAIARILRKTEKDSVRKVRLMLSIEQYDALFSYYYSSDDLSEEETAIHKQVSANDLVRRAIEEFIDLL